MSESPNPYVAPAAIAEPNPALPPWARSVLRAALAIIVLDFARGVAWRFATALMRADFGEHFNPNVVIQLAFAVIIVFAVTSLVRRHDGAVTAAPVVRLACVGTAIAAVSMYVTRLVVDAVAGTLSTAKLSIATLALDGAVVVLAALYVAAVLTELRAVEAARRVKTLAGFYVVMMVAALVVVTNTAQRHGFLPPSAGSGIRSVATLFFVGLGVVAYRSLASLARR